MSQNMDNNMDEAVWTKMHKNTGKTIDKSENENLDQNVENRTSHYIFANDFSGSTSGCSFYHKIARDYLQKFTDYIANKTDAVPEKNVHYILWDYEWQKITVGELIKIYSEEEGRGWTEEPVRICEYIKENIENGCNIELWLLTDGEIGGGVEECLKLNKSIIYSKVNFIIINEYGINMSVGCSFFTNTSLEIYENTELFKRVNTKVEYNFNDINLENFDEKIVSLQDYIQIKYMAEDERMCLEMSDKLSQLKARLLSEVQIKYLDSTNKRSLTKEIKNKEEFIEIFKQSDFYRGVTHNVVFDLYYIVDSKISTLINYLMNKKIYEFKSDLVREKIQFDQYKKEDEEEADLNLEDLPEVEKVKFTDIVSLEESSKPIVLLLKCDLIDELWVEKSKSIYKNTLSCPLFLLKNPKFKKMIGHAYDVSTFINLKEHSGSSDDMIRDPASREEAFGGIVPLREADDWNDYIVSKTFFRGKVHSKSYSLIYYVISEFAKQCEWIEKDVVECLREYAFERIKDSKCLIGFTNLPLDPKEFVPVPLACFYCCEISSILFSQDEEWFKLEKLKLFYSVVKYLIDICEYFNFDIDKNYIRKRSTMLYYVNRFKFFGKIEDKVYFLLEKVFEKDGHFYVPKLKQNYDLTGFKYMDTSPDDILPDETNEVTLNDIEKYLHLSYQVDDLKDGHSVKINKDTLRPYYMIGNNTFYHYFKQLLHHVSIQNNSLTTKNFEDSEKLDYTKFISVFKFYIKYVLKFKNHPSLEEFYEYILRKKKVHDGKIRIFTINVGQSIKNVFDLYQEFKDESIETFARKSFKSIPLEQRIELEKKLAQ